MLRFNRASNTAARAAGTATVMRGEWWHDMSGVKIISCATIRDEVESLAGGIEIEYCDGFLHDTPDKLRETLNERIAATPGECTILLAYGRCSNGTAGLVAGSHRLVLPAVDDCISLLLGRQR